MEKSYFLPFNTDTITNYVVLPLLDINKSDFSYGFINAYLSEDLDYVVVVTNENRPEYKLHKYYDTSFTLSDKSYIIYKIPDKYLSDVSLFMKGKYSKLSEECKSTIINNSGLPPVIYNKEKNTLEANRLFLALYKKESLRKLMEEELGVLIDEEAELFDIPDRSKEIINYAN